MNELKIINVVPGAIITNFEEFHNELKLAIQDYKGLVVTEENLKEMKQSRLELTRGIKLIDDQRKIQKKEFIVPLTEYEALCKAAIETIQEAENELKVKIDFFDEQVRQEKRDYAEKTAVELVSLSSLTEKYSDRIDVQKSEYTNAATSKKKIKEDLEAQIFQLTRAQEIERQNIKMVADHIETASKLANLATPVSISDIPFVLNYETMNIATTLEQITLLALKRKESEEAAIKRAEEAILAKAKAEQEKVEREIRLKIQKEQEEKEDIERLIKEKELKEQRKIEIESIQIKKQEVLETIPEEIEFADEIIFEEEKEIVWEPLEYLSVVFTLTKQDKETLLNYLNRSGLNWEVK